MYSFKDTKEIRDCFSTSENILLVSHLNPDGDTIGSQLALYHYLRSTGREVSMISPNNLPGFLKWMDSVEKIQVYFNHRERCRALIEKADLIVMLDFNQSNRLGDAESDILSSKAKKIIIDHHLHPGNIADIIISEPSKCATAELLHELIVQINGGNFMEKHYAESLYVGIVTDTGNFEHGNYTPDTLRLVADILDTGIEKDRILNLIYNNFSSDRLRLQGYALNKRMVVLPELKTAYIYLTREDLKSYNHVKGDTEGFVNIPLSISGIVFTALFIEKENFVKLSFRSKGNFPSNEFASSYFGGGGHMNAAGGEYSDTLENTIGFFIKALKENAWRLENAV